MSQPDVSWTALTPGQLDPMQAQMLADNKRLTELTQGMMKSTLDNAARSYRWITNMNVAMFVIGLALFVVSSIYALFFEPDSVAPLVIGGLGAATFIGLFLTGAIGKTQNALTNLVQVEIAFMQWFTQMGLWQGSLAAGPPDPERFTTASEAMHQRSMEAIQLLQTYTESADSGQ